MGDTLRLPINTNLALLCRDEKGATLVEYGIAIVLAIVVGTGALVTLANQININLGEAEACLAGAPAC